MLQLLIYGCTVYIQWPLEQTQSGHRGFSKYCTFDKSLFPGSNTFLLKNWLWGDYLLYEHFKAKFEDAKNRFGQDRLEDELTKLRSANDRVKDMCIEDQVDAKELPEKYRLVGPKVLGYKVKEENDSFCQLYVMKEVSFIDLIRSIYEVRGL